MQAYKNNHIYVKKHLIGVIYFTNAQFFTLYDVITRDGINITLKYNLSVT